MDETNVDDPDMKNRLRYLELMRKGGMPFAGSWLWDERDQKWRLDIAWCSDESPRGKELRAEWNSYNRSMNS